MKKLLITFQILGLMGLLAACGSTATESSIVPTEGKLTFAFFFTDN